MSEMVERVARAISTYAIMYSHETVGDDLRTRNKLWQVYEMAKAGPDKPPTEFIGRFTDKFEAQKFCAQMNARAAIEAMPSWVELKDAPLDEVGFVWCADPAWGDDTTQRGRVVEWGSQRIAVGSFHGFEITHWHPAPPASPALRNRRGE